MLEFFGTVIGMTFISGCFAAKTAKFCAEKYVLYQTLSTKNVKVVKLPELIIKKKKVRSKLKQEDLDKIDKFKEILNEKIPNINIKFLNDRLDTLVIKRLKVIPSEKNTVRYGDYDIKKNKIRIANDLSLVHELLHFSSSTHIKNINFGGFSQTITKVLCQNVGKGLNEGYTSLLEYKYFPETHTKNTYYLERTLAQLVEKIIGKEKMEKLYFSADLHGIIEHLKIYKTEEEIIRFIKNYDFLSRYLFSNSSNKILNINKNNLYYIFKFLLECYHCKLLEDYKNGNISFENIEIQTIFFTSILIDCVDIACKYNSKLNDQEYFNLFFEYISVFFTNNNLNTNNLCNVLTKKLTK